MFLFLFFWPGRIEEYFLWTEKNKIKKEIEIFLTSTYTSWDL